MSQPTAERRALRMHPKLLWDVITKQAGTIEKAILEGVMNSVDAGASKVEVTLTEDRFTLKDDGKGFVGREEIENFFETFGHPHEEGDATYGRFRMGRGQMMAFGANFWKSNTYGMLVDIKPQEGNFSAAGGGLLYELQTLDKNHPGCEIVVDLYEKLLPSQLNTCIRELGEFVRYTQIPVLLNGKQINVLPSEYKKWTHDTPEAYMELKDVNHLTVYNLGVLVARIPSYSYGGVGGIIVSKKPLTINFARNQVLSSCPTMKKISETLRGVAGIQRKSKVRLTDADREAMAEELVSGQLDLANMVEAKLITDVMGNHVPVKRLVELHGYNNRVSYSPIGERKAERVHNTTAMFVVGAPTLDRFGVKNTQELYAKIAKAMAVAAKYKPGRDAYLQAPYGTPAYDAIRFVTSQSVISHRDPSEFAMYMSDDYETVDDKKLSKFEKVALQAIQSASNAMYQSLSQQVGFADSIPIDFGKSRWQGRQIRIGESDVANGWTDGVDNIWINKNLVPLVKEGYSGWARIAGLLLHEYLHGEPDTKSHIHDEFFYRLAHDLALHTPVIGVAIKEIEASLYRQAKANKGMLTDHQAKKADRIETIRRKGIPIELPDQEPADEPDMALAPAM